MFKSYAVTFTIVYLFTTAFAIPTGGLMSLVLPSMYYFMLRSIELIGYYKTKGFSFYTDATTVINTVEYGFRAEQQAEDFVTTRQAISNHDRRIRARQKKRRLIVAKDDNLRAEFRSEYEV